MCSRRRPKEIWEDGNGVYSEIDAKFNLNESFSIVLDTSDIERLYD